METIKKNCLNNPLPPGSYPTYEEWKRKNIQKVMQNGLKSSYPTYEEWKRAKSVSSCKVKSFVLILPMRNGNRHRVDGKMIEEYVLILPMRNGNILGFDLIPSHAAFLSYL